ncbi:MAG TPA: hypothetical protein DCG57_07075 [Candidatus Riflebacteria bacterium]|jgi:hypothetical protein|nr:hypothetical protein [Candidatus Riflebacteria bacterium]
MTVPEIIGKYFLKKNGFQPEDVDVSDHFAVGCMLIIQGFNDAGIKMISGAFKLIGDVNATSQKQLKAYAKKNPEKAFLLVKPHHEIEKAASRLLKKHKDKPAA